MFSHSSSRNILREFQYSLMLLALLIDEITKVRAQSTLRAMGHCWLLPCPRSRTLGVHVQVRGKKKAWQLEFAA